MRRVEHRLWCEVCRDWTAPGTFPAPAPAAAPERYAVSDERLRALTDLHQPITHDEVCFLVAEVQAAREAAAARGRCPAGSGPPGGPQETWCWLPEGHRKPCQFVVPIGTVIKERERFDARLAALGKLATAMRRLESEIGAAVVVRAGENWRMARNARIADRAGEVLAVWKAGARP